MSFADAARRLAGQAGLLLGCRPDEFWRATPNELADALAPLRPPDGAALDRADLSRLMKELPDDRG